MKIRHPLLIKMIAFIGALVFRIWMSTLRYKYRTLDENVEPNREGLRGRYIYTFWHETVLLPAYHYGQQDIHVLISQHADGQFIAELCRHMGFRVIRGSTTRGGVEAVRQMVRAGGSGHLALVPDGPRGPRRRVQQGIIYLASRTGLPIVPAGIAFRKPWRLNSWDRFAIPKPWTRAVCLTGFPITVPTDLEKDQIDHYRRRLEEALLELTERAEHWAECVK